MPMKVSKGLEFPVVDMSGVGHMSGPGEDEKEAVRVFYVTTTRATHHLNELRVECQSTPTFSKLALAKFAHLPNNLLE